jgi:uncharacterized protein involved in oxidation of intracellular sulfur
VFVLPAQFGRGVTHIKTLIICDDPPNGTERSWNGLHLARLDGVEVLVFLLGDTVGCAVPGQKA